MDKLENDTVTNQATKDNFNKTDVLNKWKNFERNKLETQRFG